VFPKLDFIYFQSICLYDLNCIYYFLGFIRYCVLFYYMDCMYVLICMVFYILPYILYVLHILFRIFFMSVLRIMFYSQGVLTYIYHYVGLQIYIHLPWLSWHLFPLFFYAHVTAAWRISILYMEDSRTQVCRVAANI